MPLKIVRSDITKMKVTAIVNTANPRPIIGGGVDRVIHHAAGAELLRARQEIGEIAAGEARITPAFNLPAKFVIHTVGAVWHDGKSGEKDLLRRCYENSLELARQHKCASIAFPLISSGVYGFPTDIALAVARKTIENFLQTHEMNVYLVVFDRRSFRLSGQLFNEVKNYLDENYVEEMLTAEYADDSPYRRRIADFCAAPAPALDIPSYRTGETADEAPIINKIEKYSKKAFHASKIALEARLEDELAEAERSLEDELAGAERSFSEELLHIIDRQGKKDPAVYKKANIDRRLFSKIRNNTAYQPSKMTALALAVALELNMSEAADLIGRAGYAFSHSSKADIIVEYFIKHSQYDILKINETLFAFQQPLLGG